MKTTQKILTEILDLVQEKGYIYALCMIAYEDFHLLVNDIHIVDFRERLSVKEFTLLFGYFIKKEIDFSFPNSLEVFRHQIDKTYNLLEELHQSLQKKFNKDELEQLETTTNDNADDTLKALFNTSERLIESIYYSGTGVYDFQYFEYLDSKYKYDKEWILKNKKTSFDDLKSSIKYIDEALDKNSSEVCYIGVNENVNSIIKKLNENEPSVDWNLHKNDIEFHFKLLQYSKLFPEKLEFSKEFKIINLKQNNLEVFFKNLLNLFIININDCSHKSTVQTFLGLFSISLDTKQNVNFNNIGEYNIIDSHPIIAIDENRFFVPIMFQLYEALYENPYYWMLEDDDYKDNLSLNRGTSSEDMTIELLSKVFDRKNIYREVLISSTKKHTSTDIDILCVQGSKALCVQVKSKKLTSLSKTGNLEHLHKDFKAAVQDAYLQAIKCRNEILKGDSIFSQNGKKLILPQGIDEVYLLTITSENYPSLVHQSQMFLEKEIDEPYPMVMTIFDLELVSHYLDDPFDFLYYVRQRAQLTNSIIANEELVFLSYHLQSKLHMPPQNGLIILDSSCAGELDKDYSCYKHGINNTNGEKIKILWKNEIFNRLCNKIKTLGLHEAIDIIFHLFDLNGETREELANMILLTKNKTLQDKENHNFRISPSSKDQNIGYIYLSHSGNDYRQLAKDLSNRCKNKKYSNKADKWIGFGSVSQSTEIIDIVQYLDYKWEYDYKLEEIASRTKTGTIQRLGKKKKIGRNDPCPCGSGLKYKKCCGSVL